MEKYKAVQISPMLEDITQEVCNKVGNFIPSLIFLA